MCLPEESPQGPPIVRVPPQVAEQVHAPLPLSLAPRATTGPSS